MGQREAVMVHVRCWEQMSAMLLFQIMPGFGQTFVRTVTPVSAYRPCAPRALFGSLRQGAIGQARQSTPWVQGLRGNERN